MGTTSRVALQESTNTMQSPSSLRVVDLRNELKSRGLPHGGLKRVLIERLREARSSEASDACELAGEESPADEPVESPMAGSGDEMETPLTRALKVSPSTAFKRMDKLSRTPPQLEAQLHQRPQDVQRLAPEQTVVTNTLRTASIPINPHRPAYGGACPSVAKVPEKIEEATQESPPASPGTTVDDAMCQLADGKKQLDPQALLHTGRTSSLWPTSKVFLWSLLAAVVFALLAVSSKLVFEHVEVENIEQIWSGNLEVVTKTIQAVAEKMEGSRSSLMFMAEGPPGVVLAWWQSAIDTAACCSSCAAVEETKMLRVQVLELQQEVAMLRTLSAGN